MTRLRCAALLAAVVLARLVHAAPSEVKQRSPAELLPASTVAYAELLQPKQLLDTLLEHPLRRKLEAHDDYRHATSTPQFLQFKLVVSAIEAQLGMTWPVAIEAVTGDGLTAAIDLETQGLAVIAKSRDAKALAKVVETLIRLARDDARNKGNADPFQPSEYRQVTIYASGDARIAIHDAWLIVTNKEPLLRQILDNSLTDGAPSLAADGQFVKARASNPPPRTAWAYVNLKRLREVLPSAKAFSGKADEPVGELLLGGVLDLLTKALYATAELAVTANRMTLGASAPCAADSVSAPRKYYFGEQSNGAAPAPLEPRQRLVSFTAYRDLAAFWAAAPDLFNAALEAKFEQADSQLSAFFSGRNFGRDILAGFAPDLQFVATRQPFAGRKLPTPDIKLPAFAVVLHLNDPDKIRRSLKTSFQSIVGFANVAGGQAGQPQLELETIQRGNAEIVAANYLPPEAGANKQAGKINYNFSPSLALVGDRLVLSSTQSLAEEIAELFARPATERPADKQATVNTRLLSNSDVLKNVLADNRQQLVAQNMLEKGHSRDQAEKEIGILLELLGYLRDVSLELSSGNGALRLDLGIDVSDK